jgi:hypothetical protein
VFKSGQTPGCRSGHPDSGAHRVGRRKVDHDLLRELEEVRLTLWLEREMRRRYGTSGITVAVRIGFDDDRSLGRNETGGRLALPIFREVMLGVYRELLAGRAPRFPREIEDGIDQYLAALAAQAAPPPILLPQRAGNAASGGSPR